MQISVRSQTAAETTLSWQPVAGAARYRILWSDRPGETVRFKTAGESGESLFTFCRSTHIPYYIKVQALAENGALLEESTPVQTPVGRVLQQQLEALSRGLVAVTANTGVFISWRLFKSAPTLCSIKTGSGWPPWPTAQTIWTRMVQAGIPTPWPRW